MKKVIMLFFMALFMGGLFACTEVKTDAKKLEGKWSIVEVKGKKLAKEILMREDLDEYSL